MSIIIVLIPSINCSKLHWSQSMDINSPLKVLSSILRAALKFCTCQISQPRPVVVLPCRKVSNEIVAMDLKKVPDFPNVYILHVIDSVTGQSAARIIYNKRKETIIQGICIRAVTLGCYTNPPRCGICNLLCEQYCDQWHHS